VLHAEHATRAARTPCSPLPLPCTYIPREEEDSDIVRVRDLVVRETHLWQLLKGV
jgi:hypothetical protein